MSKSKFVHLHVHSEYSLLDGLSKIKPLVAKAKKMGMDALALTDHGVMYGAIEFYKECRRQGIKPILNTDRIRCSTKNGFNIIVSCHPRDNILQVCAISSAHPTTG